MIMRLIRNYVRYAALAAGLGLASQVQVETAEVLETVGRTLTAILGG